MLFSTTLLLLRSFRTARLDLAFRCVLRGTELTNNLKIQANKWCMLWRYEIVQDKKSHAGTYMQKKTAMKYFLKNNCCYQ